MVLLQGASIHSLRTRPQVYFDADTFVLLFKFLNVIKFFIQFLCAKENFYTVLLLLLLKDLSH